MGNNPLSYSDYVALTQDAGIEIIQLPVLLSATAIFHSIAAPNDGAPDVNLTSCMLARIFKRDIVDWLDPAILEVNPKLEYYINSGNAADVPSVTTYPITVARRNLGSSSTATFTQVSL